MYALSGQLTLNATSDVGGGIDHQNQSPHGKITGAGGLVKTGGNTVYVTNATSHAGGTAINSGILLLTSTGSLSNRPVTVNHGAV